MAERTIVFAGEARIHDQRADQVLRRGAPVRLAAFLADDRFREAERVVDEIVLCWIERRDRIEAGRRQAAGAERIEEYHFVAGLAAMLGRPGGKLAFDVDHQHRPIDEIYEVRQQKPAGFARAVRTEGQKMAIGDHLQRTRLCIFRRSFGVRAGI